MLCIGTLMAIAIVDAKSGVIPDVLSYSFLLLAFIQSMTSGTPSLFPATIGGGFFAAQWVGSRGRWIGSGDIIVGAGIGFLLNDVTLIVFALAVAYVVGAVIASVLLLSHRVTFKSRLAFAPFLAAGTIVAWTWGK